MHKHFSRFLSTIGRYFKTLSTNHELCQMNVKKQQLLYWKIAINFMNGLKQNMKE